MGSSTRFSTHSAEIPHTFAHSMEYFPSCMEYFSPHIPHTFPHRMENEKALISSYYHNNDRLERITASSFELICLIKIL
jgi:hypothetical protein